MKTSFSLVPSSEEWRIIDSPYRLGLDQGLEIAALVTRTRRLGELRMSASHFNFILNARDDQLL